MNSLTVLKKTIFGAFLIDERGDEEVLLPNKYVSNDFNVDDVIDVFLYTDSEDRIVATTLVPKIFLHQIAVLQVKDITHFGAFLDWGLEKDLFLPFSEQAGRVQVGDQIAVTLCLDARTHRLFASAKMSQCSRRDLTVKEGDVVDLVISSKTELGYQVIINNLHVGLIFFNEIFQTLHMGDQVKGVIKKIRDDGKIDAALQKQGYANVLDSEDVLLKKLQENKGILYLTDNSDPRVIAMELSMSKKTFKKCVGALYKKRKIIIEKDRIVLSSHS